MKRFFVIVLSFFMILILSKDCFGAGEKLNLPVRAAVLIDNESGAVLFEQNKDIRLSPASVTKVMSMLLILEAIDKGQISWDDKVKTSTAASQMGGSQIFLKEGEEMIVSDLFKSVAVVSANDASTVLAEHIYGSDIDFIRAMNQKASELGLKNTHFINETGLPAEGHYSSAYDLAMISRELLKHPQIFKYTSIWMDSVREGQFVLRNTNELIRTYNGADGLKTGHTADAKFCLAATAKRNDFRLISVILGAESNQERLNQTKRLLDYGYRNYQRQVLANAGTEIAKETIENARTTEVPLALKRDLTAVLPWDEKAEIEIEISPKLKLPLKKNSIIGKAYAVAKGKRLSEAPLYTKVEVKKAFFLVRWWRSLKKLIANMFKKHFNEAEETFYEQIFFAFNAFDYGFAVSDGNEFGCGRNVLFKPARVGDKSTGKAGGSLL